MKQKGSERPAKVRRGLRTRIRRFQVRVRRTLPPGLRLVLGLAFIGGGVLGFLPILGFWMLPLGVAVAALDVVPLWRRMQTINARRASKRALDRLRRSDRKAPPKPEEPEQTSKADETADR